MHRPRLLLSKQPATFFFIRYLSAEMRTMVGARITRPPVLAICKNFFCYKQIFCQYSKIKIKFSNENF